MAAENKILNNAIVKIGNAQSEEHRLTVYHSDNTSVSIYGYGLYMNRTNSYIRPSNDGSQILAIGTDNNTWNYVAFDVNYFTVSTNASEHFRITNTGNVGIGTTSPGAKLDVAGSIGVTSGDTFGYDNYNGSIYMASSGRGLLGKFAGSGYARNLIKSDGSATVHIGDNTSLISRILLDAGSSGVNGYISLQTKQTERVRINSNGNVGVGTTSPGAKLDVRDGALFVGNYSGVVTPTDGIWLERPAGNSTKIQMYTLGSSVFNITSDGTTANIGWGSGANREVNFQNTGAGTIKVGIGTGSPGDILHVSKTGAATRLRVGNNAAHDAFIYFNTSTDWSIGTDTSNSNSLTFGNSSGLGTNTKMVIETSGNVGIGTTSPHAELVVNGKIDTSDTTNGAFRIYDGSTFRGGWGTANWAGTNFGDQSADLIAYVNGSNKYFIGTNGQPRLTVDGSGNVGIGTTSPSEKLHIGSGTVPAATLDGVLLTLGSGQYYQASDGTKTVFMGVDSSSYGIVGMLTNHPLGFRTNNTERMRILGNGNVGIGTTSPSEKLHVVGNVKFDGSRDINFDTNNGNIRITPNSGGWATGYFFNGSAGTNKGGFGAFGSANALTYYWIGDEYNDTTMVIQPNAGNVGIGTTTPQFKLDISDSSSGAHQIALRNTGSGQAGIWFDASNGDLVGSDYAWIRQNNDLTFELGVDALGGDILFTEGGSERMRISSGNVGIGTTSPSAKLHIASSEAVHLVSKLEQNNSGRQAWYEANSQDGGYARFGIGDNANNFAFWNTDQGAYKWYGSGVERMNLTNAGNLGIGTTSPTAPLHVIGTVRMGNTSEGLTFTAGSGIGNIIGVDTGFAGYNAIALKASANTGIYLDTADNVGIGTTSPGSAFKLDVNGYIKANSRLYVRDSTKTVEIGTDYIQSYVTSGAGVNPIRFFTGTTEKARIDGNGNVGIGTTNPISELHVVGSARVVTNDSAGGDTLIGAINGVSNGYRILTNTSNEITYSWHTGDNIEALTINNNGKVGIGTTSPSEKLHVFGNGIFHSNGSQGTIRVGRNTNQEIQIYVDDTNNIITAYQDSDGNSGHVFALDREFDGSGPNYFEIRKGGSAQMHIDSSGNVGIGTTTPTSLLEISQQLSAVSTIDYPYTISSRDDGNTLNQLGGEGVGIKFRIAGNASATPGDSLVGASIAAIRESSGDSDSSTGLGFFITQNDETLDEAVRIDHDGNVGIGTTTPTQKLDVNGDIAVKGASVINKASAALTIGDTAGTDSVTNLTLTTAGGNTEVFLDDSGNVGINTATPSYNLTVNSGTNDIGILTASSDSGSYVGFLDNSTSTIPKIGAVGNKLVLDASQYVGVRRTDPSYALDVNGTIRATGNVIAYSDARVKENVETIPNALDKVKAMRGVGYNKIGEEKRSIGVIAQELLEVVPEAVHQDEKGMYSVAYGNLVGVLVEAMKEQQQQIDELKAKLDGITK